MGAAVPIIAAVSAIAGTAMSVASAQQQAGAARIQAQQARLTARQGEVAAMGEEARGQSAALDVREQLLRTLSAQRARYAAAGVSLDSGTPMDLADETATIADRQLDILGSQTRINAAARRIGVGTAGMRASLLDDQAEFTQTAGYAGAAIGATRSAINLFDAMPGTVTKPGKPAPAGQSDGMF